MKDEYIIISKKAVQKELSRLKQQRNVEPDNYTQSYINGKIKQLEWVLSQSTPLIPEIEKAFDEGQNRMQHEIIEKLGLKYQTEQVSQSTILNMEVHSEDYISNLKLDI